MAKAQWSKVASIGTTWRERVMEVTMNDIGRISLMIGSLAAHAQIAVAASTNETGTSSSGGTFQFDEAASSLIFPGLIALAAVSLVFLIWKVLRAFWRWWWPIVEEIGDSDSGEFLRANTKSLQAGSGLIRLMARLVDICCLIALFALLFPKQLPRLIARANVAISDVAVFIMVILFIWVFVETLLLNVFQTTPGKRLFNISIGLKDGSRIGFVTALKRSFRVWFWGLGMGIPLIWILTTLIAFVRLMISGQTSWDRDGGVVIRHKISFVDDRPQSSRTEARLESLRWTLISTVMMFAFFATGALLSSIVVYGLMSLSGPVALLAVLTVGAIFSFIGSYFSKTVITRSDGTKSTLPL